MAGKSADKFEVEYADVCVVIREECADEPGVCDWNCDEVVLAAGG